MSTERKPGRPEPSPDVATSEKRKSTYLQDIKMAIYGTLFWTSGAAAVLVLDKNLNEGRVLKYLEVIANKGSDEIIKDQKPDPKTQKKDPDQTQEVVRETSELKPAKDEPLVNPEEIKINDATMIAALLNIKNTFGSAPKDKEILILKDHANAMDFCTFNDKWVQRSKEELEIMYKYIDEKMEKNPEAKKALLGNLFETLISLKKGMQGGLLTRFKADKIPVNKEGLDKRIEEFVNSPIKNKTSCGMGFSLGFSLLGNEGHAQIQTLIVEFIKTLSTSILEDLNSQDENVKKIARERYVTLINLIEKARRVELKTKSR